jgi:iron complex transport system permease protein
MTASPARSAGDPLAAADAAAGAPRARRPHIVRMPLAVSALALVAALLLGVAVGPVRIGLGEVLGTLLHHAPLLHYRTSTPVVDQAIVWQVRLPRVVLAALVGAMLAAGGASYQGVLRNSLADPYLLGVAAGAGLGATVAIIAHGGGSLALPAAAFAGAVLAVALTYVVAAAGGGQASGYAIILAGVAVAAMLTALQTYLQQQHTQEIRQIYNWILGSFSVASWSDVRLVLPYIAISGSVLLAHRRILDVLRVGGEEAGALGINPERTRLVIVGAATLGTAAAVSVSGLIGFVGIIVPHAVRLAAGASYRVVLPVSMVTGAAFLVLADVLARTVEAPTEVPIGVVTAIIGAPFFLLILRSRRTRQAVL